VKIGVIGMGYVGTVTAAVFADQGYEVVGVDRNKWKVELLSKGVSPIYEPGLENLLRKNLGRLKFTTDYNELKDCNVVFIAVSTPPKPSGEIDLSNVFNAVEKLMDVGYDGIIAIKSTVIPGTARKVERMTGLPVVSNPEFLREGNAVYDTLHPDRIVIGSRDKYAGDVVEEIWSFTKAPIIRTTPENAELIKYAANAFLAVKLSFINEIANLCEKIEGCDVEVIAKGIGLDKRISPYYLKAGIGYGGSCLPKDTRAITYFARQLGEPLTIVEAAIKVNEERISRVVRMAEELIGNLKGKRIAVLGLAFKENTDDVRESQAIKLVRKLKEHGAIVKAYDPKALNNALKVVEFILAKSVEECLEGCELAIIATGWSEFKEKVNEDLLIKLGVKALIDGRRVLDPNRFKKIRFKAIGLRTTKTAEERESYSNPHSDLWAKH